MSLQASVPGLLIRLLVVRSLAQGLSYKLQMTRLYSGTSTNRKVAKRVGTSPNVLEDCGARLRSGHLVAFPTETVYGLGCHALDEIAVRRVFAAKERPLTDPLIVHVASAAEALQLWCAIDFETRQVLNTLCQGLWPGPLTVVSRAAVDDFGNSAVPPLVMANTGYVAVRCPSHELARALIRAARVPIAAPSANKFGHVSPTRADHVLRDLGQEDVWVMDPELDTTENDKVCQVGVESTVVKLDTSNGPLSLHILRHGAISQAQIQQCLLSAGITNVPVLDFKPNVDNSATGPIKHVAPGQEIRHYSPDVPSFMLDAKFCASLQSNTNDCDQHASELSSAVLLDFGAQLAPLKAFALAYRDLSTSANATEAAANVFEALRWAESVPNASRVYFPQITLNDESSALLLALKDRLTRAASGVIVTSL